MRTISLFLQIGGPLNGAWGSMKMDHVPWNPCIPTLCTMYSNNEEEPYGPPFQNPIHGPAEWTP